MNGRRSDRRTFAKRAAVFASMEFILGVVVLARLAYLQIFQAEHYKLLSDKNRIVSKCILPNRGRILDINGNLLAKNEFSYSAILDLFAIKSTERAETITALLKHHDLGQSVVEKLKNLPRVVNNENSFILLQADLDWRTLSKYYLLRSKVPGLTIEKSQRRCYLFPEIFSHIIGYTGAPTKSDIESSSNFAFSVPTAKIGKIGIEKQYDKSLFGCAGIKHIEVDSRRRFVRDIDNISPTAGEDLTLTIDLALQQKVAELVSQHESATCVVIDIHTGAILAFVSHPGYDANLFTQKVNGAELMAFYDNPYKPMINKLIHGLYSPGSAFKMMTGLAALKRGLITKHTRFTCRGVYELGRHKFHCWKWKYGGHGSINLQEALAGSCDVFFYNLARLLSPDEIAATAHDFGLGEPTGIDLPNEKSGLIPTKSWKKKHKKQSWTTGDTFNMSIGQGFVLTTPLQLVKMTAMLANGLKPITPHLVKREIADEATYPKYDPEHIQVILDGTYDVVNAPHGTAWKAGLDDFEFCGKTGSSQVFRITERLRREGKTVSDDYWKKEHAIFVGYAPADVPRVAVEVLVEHGGSGAHTAAPLARDVLLAAKAQLGF